MTVDRPAFYGSRNMLDHHRDMRLDIDNMSYEVTLIFLPLLFCSSYGLSCILNFLKCPNKQELLALGETIGNVNTGLSEDLILKCLTETIYCSSDQIQEEVSCAICLVRVTLETENYEIALSVRTVLS